MKKFILLALLLSLIFGTAYSQLTHRGGSEFPAEIVLTDFKDYEAGDIIFSAYEFDGMYYASWKDTPKPDKKTGKFFVRCMADDNLFFKTGVYRNELPVYILYRNESYTLLNLDRRKTSGYWIEGSLSLTDNQVVLHDNLYYSFCPEWPNKNVTIARKPIKANSYEYFYTFFNFNEVLPKYYDKIEFEIEVGDGRYLPKPSMTMCRYKFTQSDINRGFIKLKARVTPFINCPIDIDERVITIEIPSYSGSN